MLNDVLATMKEVFEVSDDLLSAETQFGDFPKWDSMGHMDLMLALESKFGVEINADSIRDLVSVKAILEAVEVKQNG